MKVSVPLTRQFSAHRLGSIVSSIFNGSTLAHAELQLDFLTEET
jgi:hypothetical protein